MRKNDSKFFKNSLKNRPNRQNFRNPKTPPNHVVVAGLDVLGGVEIYVGGGAFFLNLNFRIK